MAWNQTDPQVVLNSLTFVRTRRALNRGGGGGGGGGSFQRGRHSPPTRTFGTFALEQKGFQEREESRLRRDVKVI